MIVGAGPLAAAVHHYVGDTDWLWIAHGEADLQTVELAIAQWDKPQYPKNALVVISTPMPLGSCAHLEQRFPRIDFAVVPENIRQAHAIEDFPRTTRVLGARRPQPYLSALINRLSGQVIEMSPEQAELTKHALNSLLALQCEFGNELGRIGERHGIDVGPVVQALRADPRIGAKAYLEPGGEPGPHLLREVDRLAAL